jgi:hypothetical protein
VEVSPASGNNHAAAPQRLSAVSIESRAFALAVLVMLLLTAGAFLFFLIRSQHPALSGDGSVGQFASLAVAVVGLGIFAMSYSRSFQRPESAWLRQTALARRILDISALSFTHALIAFMLCQAVFSLFQSAFSGLTLEPLAGGLFVGVSGAATAYTVSLSGARITTYSLSNLLAAFLLTGALTAMITADDPSWWRINFSALGTETNGLAAYAFNATLIFSGLVITTLASYMTRDLRRWAQFRKMETVNAKAVQWTLILLGGFLSGVGLVPVDALQLLHNFFATGMIFVFFALALGLHAWVPDFPRSFFLTTYALLAGIMVAVLLFWPLGYYNLTGLELAVAALIFGWLILFIRNIAALVEDAEEDPGVSAGHGRTKHAE